MLRSLVNGVGVNGPAAAAVVLAAFAVAGGGQVQADATHMKTMEASSGASTTATATAAQTHQASASGLGLGGMVGQSEQTAARRGPASLLNSGGLNTSALNATTWPLQGSALVATRGSIQAR